MAMQCLNHSSCPGNEVYYYDIVIESLELLISDQCKKILTLCVHVHTYIRKATLKESKYSYLFGTTQCNKKISIVVNC